jgi:hypothetical protein
VFVYGPVWVILSTIVTVLVLVYLLVALLTWIA